jgi:hypothetical protein
MRVPLKVKKNLDDNNGRDILRLEEGILMVDLEKQISDLLQSSEKIREALRLFEIGQSEYEKALELLNYSSIKTVSNSNDAIMQI